MAEKQIAASEQKATPPEKVKKQATTKTEADKPQCKKGLFEKIQAVRVGLQDMEIKKSGKMNGRDNKLYLELADFIHPLNQLMLAERFTAIVNFTPENATLTAYDFDSDQTFTITSPMREAKVQGCNEMQNLGAVETYQRRYLYMAMFDIAESDILDGGADDNGKPKVPVEKPTPEQLKEAQDLKLDLNKVAAYWKKSVDEISKEDLAKSIQMQKDAIAKLQAKKAAQEAKQQAEQQQSDSEAEDAK